MDRRVEQAVSALAKKLQAARTKMSGEKRPASFGSTQMVKRARGEINGNEVATVNGGGSNALIQGVSLCHFRMNAQSRAKAAVRRAS